jgi:hypothetical protein
MISLNPQPLSGIFIQINQSFISIFPICPEKKKQDALSEVPFSSFNTQQLDWTKIL